MQLRFHGQAPDLMRAAARRAIRTRWNDSSILPILVPRATDGKQCYSCACQSRYRSRWPYRREPGQVEDCNRPPQHFTNLEYHSGVDPKNSRRSFGTSALQFSSTTTKDDGRDPSGDTTGSTSEQAANAEDVNRLHLRTVELFEDLDDEYELKPEPVAQTQDRSASSFPPSTQFSKTLFEDLYEAVGEEVHALQGVEREASPTPNKQGTEMEQISEHDYMSWSRTMTLLRNNSTAAKGSPNWLIWERYPSATAADETFHDLARSLHANGLAVSEKRKIWLSYSDAQRASQWQDLMTGFLLQDPYGALDFLEATSIVSKPPSFQISGTLDVLVRYALRDNWSEHHLRRILRFIQSSLDPQSQVKLTHHTVFGLLWHPNLLSVPGVASGKEFFDVLDRKAALTPATALTFADHFAARRNYSRCVYALMKARKMIGPAPSDSFDKVCAQVLSVIPKAHQPTMIRLVVRLGASMGIEIHNALMQSAFKRGDYEAGWEIFTACKTKKLPFTPKSFAILFRAARLQDSTRMLLKVNNLAKRRMRILWQDPHAIFQMLLAAAVTGKRNTFNRVLNIYTKFWNVQILKDLKIIGDDWEPRHPHSGLKPEITKRDPTPECVAVIITSWLRQNPPALDVASSYIAFRALTHRRDPRVMAFSQDNYVWNSYIRRLLNYKDWLELWPILIRDMATCLQGQATTAMSHVVSPATDDVAIQKVAKGTVPEQSEDHVQTIPSLDVLASPTPDQVTWNIVARALAYGDKSDDARELMRAMESRKMPLDQSTWHFLLSSYARAQDLVQIRTTIACIHARYDVTSKYINLALRDFKDRRLLQSILMDKGPNQPVNEDPNHTEATSVSDVSNGSLEKQRPERNAQLDSGAQAWSEELQDDDNKIHFESDTWDGTASDLEDGFGSKTLKAARARVNALAHLRSGAESRIEKAHRSQVKTDRHHFEQLSLRRRRRSGSRKNATLSLKAAETTLEPEIVHA